MGRTNDSKIRILMVLGNTGRGGAQTYAMNVLRNIDKDRFHIDFAVNYVYENGYTDEIRELGSEILVIPKFKGINYVEYIRTFNSILTNGKYDIVHGHVSSSASLYLRLAKEHGCKTIAHSHSAGYRGNAAEQVIKKMFTIGAKRYADYWFGCSRLAAERMFGKDYEKSPKYYDIPNAIISSRYLYDTTIRERIRKSLSIPNDAIVYGHVGSFSTPKNHKFLIDVFEQIFRDQGEKSYYIICGEGALKESIEQEVRTKSFSEHAIFTGNVGNVNEYMMAMDVLVFPSLFEGFPVTLLEAQAAGLYCVSSDTITTEVTVTENVRPLSLECSRKEWAMIAETAPDINRIAANETVRASRYNMDNSINELMSLYKKMAEHNR